MRYTRRPSRVPHRALVSAPAAAALHLGRARTGRNDLPRCGAAACTAGGVRRRRMARRRRDYRPATLAPGVNPRSSVASASAVTRTARLARCSATRAAADPDARHDVVAARQRASTRTRPRGARACPPSRRPSRGASPDRPRSVLGAAAGAGAAPAAPRHRSALDPPRRARARRRAHGTPRSRRPAHGPLGRISRLLQRHASETSIARAVPGCTACARRRSSAPISGTPR